MERKDCEGVTRGSDILPLTADNKLAPLLLSGCHYCLADVPATTLSPSHPLARHPIFFLIVPRLHFLSFSSFIPRTIMSYFYISFVSLPSFHIRPLVIFFIYFPSHSSSFILFSSSFLHFLYHSIFFLIVLLQYYFFFYHVIHTQNLFLFFFSLLPSI